MRSNRCVCLAAAALVCGCALEPSVVTVDLALASRDDLSPIASESPLAKPSPPTFSESSGTLFGLKEKPAAVGDMKRDAARAKEILEHNRLVAFRSLREQLFRSYRKEVEVWRLTRSLELFKIDSDATSVAYDEIGARLRAIAPDRARVLSELAFLTTFPIQPPENWAPVSAESPWRVKRRERAFGLYQSLKDIDRDFDAAANQILEDARQKAIQRQTDFQLAYADELDNALMKASMETGRIMESSAKELESELADFEQQPQVGAPPMQVVVRTPQIPASAQPPAPASAPSKLEAAKRRASHDLKIWLALKGYRLAVGGEAARDATQEFLEWRRTNHPGP